MKSFHKLALVLGSGALLLSSGVSAYVLNGQDWTYQASPMGENWTICRAGTTGLTAAQDARTVEGAQAWNYSLFNFTFGPDDTVSPCSPYTSNNGVNGIDFAAVGTPGSTLAQTTWWFNAANDILDCDMRFDDEWNWYTGAGLPVPAGQFDWRSVAEHEFGHCLSLGHSADPNALMFPSISSGTRKGIATDDINGRNAIYGTTCGVVAFASTRPSVLTSLPSEGWMLLPLLFLGGWKLSQKRRSS